MANQGRKVREKLASSFLPSANFQIYSHAFKAAVAAAKSDYPAEAANITFIDNCSSGAQSKIMAWLEKSSPEFRADLVRTGRTLNDVVTAWSKTGGMADYDGWTGRYILILQSAPGSNYLGSNDPLREIRFFFDHELGHIITRNGISPGWRGYSRPEALATPTAIEKDIYHEAETAADAFAVLRGLSKGTLTLAEARYFSIVRAREFEIHSSSYALDMMISSNQKVNPVALSPSEIKELAATFAEKYAADKYEISDLANRTSWTVYKPFIEESGAEVMKPEKITNSEWLKSLTREFRQAREDSIGGYLVTKALAEILATGKGGYEAKDDFEISPQKKSILEDHIAKRAHRLKSPWLVYPG